MSIHAPSFESSVIGLGPNTEKIIKYLDENNAVTEETWGELVRPWKIGDTIIADKDFFWKTRWSRSSEFVTTKFFDQNRDLVGIYCDVTRPVVQIPGGFSYVDLYIDVWKEPGVNPVLLDEDELDQAESEGVISATEAKRARKVARHVLTLFEQDSDIFDF